MKLPVTKESAVPSPAALWRRYTDLAFDHACAAGEAIELSSVRGTVAADRRCAGTVFLPAEPTAAEIVDDVLAVYAARTAVRPTWLSPDAATPATAALARQGYGPTQWNVLRLRSATTAAPAKSDTLVLPGRAARAAYAAWCGRRAIKSPSAGLLPLHLDDPQYEAAIALRGGVAIAATGLQTRGETTAIFDLFADNTRRRHGVATLLIGRLIDLAARAQAADVFAAVPTDDAAANAFFGATGFAPVLPFKSWTATPQ